MKGEVRFIALDVDGTIWPLDVEQAWVQLLVVRGIAPTDALDRTERFLRDHASGKMESGAYLQFFLRLIGGMARSELEELAAEVFREARRQLYREAREAIARWRQARVFVLLLSSANALAVAPVGRYLQVDDVLATELEFDEQEKCTGRIVGPYCYGAGKVDKARKFCARHGWLLSEGAYYADSISDIPMLEAVGEGHVVNPQDDGLTMIAHRRGWKIVHWNRV